MRCLRFPALLGLPRYLFLLHRGVTGIWALITAILVEGGESGRTFQKSRWLRKEWGSAWGQGCRPCSGCHRVGRAPSVANRSTLLENKHSQAYVLSRSGEEKKEFCLVSGLESHWTLLRNFSCPWWATAAGSLYYRNPVWITVAWKSDLHSVIPIG